MFTRGSFLDGSKNESPDDDFFKCGSQERPCWRSTSSQEIFGVGNVTSIIIKKIIKKIVNLMNPWIIWCYMIIIYIQLSSIWWTLIFFWGGYMIINYTQISGFPCIHSRSLVAANVQVREPASPNVIVCFAGGTNDNLIWGLVKQWGE